MNLQNSTQAPAASARTADENSFHFGKDISEFAFKKALLFLVVAGLVIRVAFFMEHVRSPSFGVPTLDQKYYDLVARMLIAGEDLHQLHGFRPLLYPMFLAVFYKIGGSWGVDLAIFVQHLLGIGTAIMVALLGARIFRHRLSGAIGGALYLLAPVPLYFEGELLIEPSYVFLITLGLVVHLRAAATSGRTGALLWLAGGALTILTAQARANIIVFMAIYPMFTAWRWWHRRDRSSLIPLLGLLGGFLMTLPWGWLNMKQSDHFHFVPNAGGVNLYLGNKRTADGMTPMQERRVNTSDRYHDSIEVWAREEYESAMLARGQQPDADPMAISRYWSGRAAEEIKAAPGAWLKLMAKKTWLTFWNAEVPNNKAFAFLQQDYLWLRILPIRWVVLLAFAPLGIWAAARYANRDGLFIVLAYVGLYSAGNIAFFICDRYRYPVWPAMAVIAGGAVAMIAQMIRTHRTREIVGTVASIALMLLVSLPNWFHAQLPTFARDYMFRSLAWYEKGHFPEALADIDKSLALDPSEATSVSHRGNILFALGRFEEAALAYGQTLKLNPGEPAAWSNLGGTLEAMGRFNDAREAYLRAVSLPTPTRNAFIGLAFVQFQLGAVDEASNALDRLGPEDSASNPIVLTLRSLIARQRGDLTQANTLEQKARSLNDATTNWAIERATKGQ